MKKVQYKILCLSVFDSLTLSRKILQNSPCPFEFGGLILGSASVEFWFQSFAIELCLVILSFKVGTFLFHQVFCGVTIITTYLINIGGYQGIKHTTENNGKAQQSQFLFGACIKYTSILTYVEC